MIEGNLLLLHQGIGLLERLPDPAYREAAPGHSTVGAQYRHILDHYRSLLDGLGDGRVDYDRRGRDPALEQDRAAAARATGDLIERLQDLARSPRDFPLRVIQSAGGDEADEAPQLSSLGRELLFLVSHTVHHFAIIKLLLAERGVACDPELGMAPSTLAYRRAAG